MMCLTDPFGSWFNALLMTNNGATRADPVRA